MVHNADDNNPNYDIMPRLWAFELSTVIDNHDILFFSKIMSKMWPHAGAVVKRLINFAADAKTMNGAQLKAKYQTKGLHDPRATLAARRARTAPAGHKRTRIVQ